MFWYFAHMILRWFPPEFAHHLAVLGLKVWQLFLRPPSKINSISLSVNNQRFAAIRFGSRVGLAAGFDKNGEVFGSLSRLGFGFLEVGTVTPIPQAGNPKPRLYRVGDQALINHMGFNNCGLEQFRKNVSRIRPLAGVPVFANVGKNKNTSEEDAIFDFVKGHDLLKDHVDGFVVNLSSPNTPGLVKLQTTGFLSAVADGFKSNKPLLIKLSPDLSDEQLHGLASWIQDCERITGVVLTNTSRNLAQSEFRRDTGGLSGPPLFSRSLACVSLVRRVLRSEKVIIGVGGINSLEKAVAFRRAGADLVEVYTSFVYQGPRLIREIAQLD